jgi:hypothetical protein
MKVRTCVMFACMTIVPALAMFSHQLPAGLREAMRTRIWEPVENWVASLTKREPAKIGRVSNVAAIEAPATPPAAEPVTEPRPVPGDVVAIARQPQTRSPSAEALAALGAMVLDCRPFDGLAGTHIASCRMAVDASGQLHRVFQAAGGSPDEAFASLLDTVRAWKERTARLSETPRF